MALLEIPPILSRIVKTLVADARPEKIILFGSHANGTAGPDSDLDLLVIWNGVEDKPKWQRRVMLRDILHEFADVPKDILTYTSEELERILTEPRSFTAQILQAGRVVYEKVA